MVATNRRQMTIWHFRVSDGSGFDEKRSTDNDAPARAEGQCAEWAADEGGELCS